MTTTNATTTTFVNHHHLPTVMNDKDTTTQHGGGDDEGDDEGFLKKGPNDTRRVVWARCEFLFFFFVFFNTDKCSYVIYRY